MVMALLTAHSARRAGTSFKRRGPVLAALVAGEAAEAFERQPAAASVERVMAVLRRIYEPQGIRVPAPVQVLAVAAARVHTQLWYPGETALDAGHEGFAVRGQTQSAARPAETTHSRQKPIVILVLALWNMSAAEVLWWLFA